MFTRAPTQLGFRLTSYPVCDLVTDYSNMSMRLTDRYISCLAQVYVFMSVRVEYKEKRAPTLIDFADHLSTTKFNEIYIYSLIDHLR
jgi:hypothetical protein